LTLQKINNKLLHLNFGRLFIFDIQNSEIIWPDLAYRITRVGILYCSYFPKDRPPSPEAITAISGHYIFSGNALSKTTVLQRAVICQNCLIDFFFVSTFLSNTGPARTN